MSLFSYEEICEECSDAVFHDCCKKFCKCLTDHKSDCDHVHGQCPYKIRRVTGGHGE